jgi:hypothetical protein
MRAIGMSALCQKQTLDAAAERALFDDLVGAGEQSAGNVEAERLRSAAYIDNHLVFGQRLDRQIGYSCSLGASFPRYQARAS